MAKNTNSTRNKAIAVGAGLAAVAAAAAGVYMMTGKNAKNRKKVAKWASDLEKDVVQELHKAGKATKATYAKIVDTAAENYKGLKEVSTQDLAIVANELKSSWDVINAELQNASKVVKTVVPKTAKTITKKVEKVNAKSPTVKAAKKVVNKAVKTVKAVVKTTAPKKVVKKAVKTVAKKVAKKAAPKKVVPKKVIPKKATPKKAAPKRRR